jgi:hypothetical protein
MKARPIAPGQIILASQENDKRDDARGGSFMLPHQQLGALALGTAPTNGQTVIFTINGTAVTFTAVTGSPTNPGDVKAPGTALGFVTNLIAALRRPDLASANYVPILSANQALIQYIGWAWPGTATSIVPFSLNKNVNGIVGALTSFSVTTTVTSGTWTAQTMQLYIEDGIYYLGTTRVIFNGGSTPTFTAPVTNPRIDIVTADASGTIAVTTGTESVTPAAPSYPANKVVICEVYHVVGETALYDYENQQAGQGYIYNDVRPTLLLPYISSLTQVAAGLFIPDPGSEVQGDLLTYGAAAWTRFPAGTTGFVLQTRGAGADPQWVPLLPLATSASSDTSVGTSDTTLLSLSMPALSANAIVKIEFMIDNANASGATNNDQYGIKAGSSDILRKTVTTPSGNVSVLGSIIIANQNSTSSQRLNGAISDQTSGTSGLLVGLGSASAAVNLGSAWTLNLFYKKGSGSQNMRGISLVATVLVP